MNAHVSCIVPIYNGERFLEETLKSICAQSHPLHEVIVVDDGSSDGSSDRTRALVEQFAENHATDRIRYLWQENRGPAAARNHGIEASTGDFISFLDADDLWHVEKTARQLARFAACPELGVSVTHVQNFWMDEVREEEERLQDHARTRPIPGYVTTTLLARRTVFEELGLFDIKLQHANITDWFLQAQEKNINVELLADVLVYRRLHRDNRSRKLATNSRQEYLRLIHKMRVRQRGHVASDA